VAWPLLHFPILPPLGIPKKVILAEWDSSAAELRIGGLRVGWLLNKAGLRSVTIVRGGCLDRRICRAPACLSPPESGDKSRCDGSLAKPSKSGHGRRRD
jgi:hypothetical protein